MFVMTLAPQVSVRFAAGRLDARLAAGEDPFGSAALALRAAQLASRRMRAQLAAGLDRALARGREPGALTAAVPVDAGAVELAQPALEQLAHALRSRERVAIRGLAITQLLLTRPDSALYVSRYPEQLYEGAREALLAL
jgi:hypothetical protein